MKARSIRKYGYGEIQGMTHGVRRTLIVFMLAVSLLLIPGQLRAQGLQDYLEMAAESNPELQSKFMEYRASLEKINEVGALPDPQVMFGYFIQPVETRVGPQQYNIQLQQRFPWFGELRAREDAAAQASQVKLAEFRELKLRLFTEVRNVWYQLYVLERSVEIARENLELLESFEELANIKFESGKGRMVDVLRVQMEIEELENMLSYLLDSQDPLLAEFSKLVGEQVDEIPAVPRELQLDSLQYGKKVILDSIIQNNPSLLALEHRKRQWEDQEKVAKKAGLPSFTIGGNYINIGERPDVEISDNGRDAWLIPQVGISIPLWRGKYNAMMEEAHLMQESVEQLRINRRNDLTSELEKYLRNYFDARRRIELYKRLINITQQSRDLLMIDYSTAGNDFEEVLRMERQQLDYALALEKARADVNTYVAWINYLMGTERY